MKRRILSLLFQGRITRRGDAGIDSIDVFLGSFVDVVVFRRIRLLEGLLLIVGESDVRELDVLVGAVFVPDVDGLGRVSLVVGSDDVDESVLVNGHRVSLLLRLSRFS
jgi:hypothetical protein